MNSLKVIASDFWTQVCLPIQDSVSKKGNFCKNKIEKNET